MVTNAVLEIRRYIYGNAVYETNKTLAYCIYTVKYKHSDKQIRTWTYMDTSLTIGNGLTLRGKREYISYVSLQFPWFFTWH